MAYPIPNPQVTLEVSKVSRMSWPVDSRSKRLTPPSSPTPPPFPGLWGKW